jgi:hypothetical protein
VGGSHRGARKSGSSGVGTGISGQDVQACICIRFF